MIANTAINAPTAGRLTHRNKTRLSGGVPVLPIVACNRIPVGRLTMVAKEAREAARRNGSLGFRTFMR